MGKTGYFSLALEPSSVSYRDPTDRLRQFIGPAFVISDLPVGSPQRPDTLGILCDENQRMHYPRGMVELPHVLPPRPPDVDTFVLS